jgi:hypothetical protein
VRNGRRGKPVARRDVELEACQSRAVEGGGAGRSTRRGTSSVSKGGARVSSRGEKKASWAAVGGRGLAWQRKEEVAWPKKGIVPLFIYMKFFKIYLNEFNQKMAFLNWKIFK